MGDKSPKTESQYEDRKKEKKEHLSASSKETIARSSHNHHPQKLDDKIKIKSLKEDNTFKHSKNGLKRR